MPAKYYVGQGKVHLGKRAADGRGYDFLFVGNVPQLTTRAETEELDHRESYTGSRFKDLKLYRNKTAMAEITFEDFNVDNVSRAFYGDVLSVAAGSVTGEQHAAKAGSIIALKRMNVSTVVVTNTAGTTTYAAGTDYILNAAAGTIEFPAGTTIPAHTGGAVNIKVNYASTLQQKLSMLSKNSQEFFLLFTGLNEADSMNPVRIQIPRFALGPAQQIDWITNANEVASFNASGEVLYDEVQAVADRFFIVEML